jgi:DNA primase
MDFVDQLKGSIDIVRVVGEYVRLRRVGSTGRYMGLCPFHQEKTPSFSVNQTIQLFKCFGCGIGGDVLKFIMEIDGLTFPETLRLLAERNGIQMPKRADYSDADSKLKGALFEMHSVAAGVFQAALRGPQGGEARGYLARRSVAQDLIDTFELGFAEPGGQVLARRFTEQGFTAEQMEASGLVRRRENGGFYDAFRGRLMFPIHNESGKVIAFGGRAMRDEDQPKYLNSPETPVYRKTSILYNLHRAREGMRKSNRAVLVEGYMDVIGVYAAGVREVVASCGTALTGTQVRVMRRHADTVLVSFDPDTAGANASERAIQILLDEGIHTRVVSLGSPDSPEKLDPDEFVKKFGPEAYQAKLDEAPSYFHWLADRARQRFDMRTSDGRMDAFKFLQPAVQKVPDKLERAAVVSDLASYLGVEPSLVLDQFRKAATDRRAQPAAAAQPTVAIPAIERMLLNALLIDPEVRVEILPSLTPDLTQGFVTREIFDVIRAVFHEDSAEAPDKDSEDSESSKDASRVPFSAIEGRLSEKSRVLLHEAVAADDTQQEGALRNQAQACIRRLESDRKRKQLDEVRARVKTAEREGKLEEALGWMSELSRLERELRSNDRELRQ